MNKAKLKLLPGALLLATVAWSLPAMADLSPQPKIAATQVAIRQLWQGHIFAVRNVVVATLDKKPAAAAEAEKQVVKNAHAIADAVGSYYGAPAGEQLFKLLAGHYGAVKGYLLATEKNDKAGQEAARKQITSNADEIAKFLAGANPNLPEDTLKQLLYTHGAHHMKQIDELKAGKYADEAETWDMMSKHMDVIADALGGAIAKQFPNKF